MNKAAQGAPLKAVLIGAPTDIGSAAPGCSMGPQALRVAGMASALSALGVQVEDSGDLSGPPNPWLPWSGSGWRNPSEALSWCQKVHDATYGALLSGSIPILMGGDHCLAAGSVAAAARHCRLNKRRLVVLWLDAHADFNTEETTPTGNMHGMPGSCLAGAGPAPMSRLAGFTPAIEPSQLRLVGVRSVDPGEGELARKMGVFVRDTRSIDETGMRHAMREALSALGPEGYLHVSFDADFLDPSVAPGVGVSEPGGATYREAQLCMEMAFDTGMLGSVDIVEINPARDVRNQTAKVCVELAASLFGKSIFPSR